EFLWLTFPAPEAFWHIHPPPFLFCSTLLSIRWVYMPHELFRRMATYDVRKGCTTRYLSPLSFHLHSRGILQIREFPLHSYYTPACKTAWLWQFFREF